MQIDGGAWQDAQLGPSGRQRLLAAVVLPLDAEPGHHNLACRVVDGDGKTQSAAREDPFPEGSSGIQQLIVKVA